MNEYLKMKIDTSKLEHFARELEREIERGGESTPLQGSLNVAGAMYMGYTRERFNRFARGGGDWAPLAESTKQRRRNKDKDHISILIDTALLQNSIAQYRTEKISGGVRVGIGGPDEGGVEYARYHQEGGPNLPKREIFVEPDNPTLERMIRALEVGLQRAINQLGGEPS